MSLLSRLFGSGPKRGSDQPAMSSQMDARDRSLIRADVGRLDKLEPGLGQKVTDYICHGLNDSVLLVLAQREKEVAEVLLGRGWSSGGAWVSGRSDYLLTPSQWLPQVAKRYGQVLAPACKTRTWLPLPGTDRSPDWFRALMQHYSDARRMVLNPKTAWKTPPGPRAKEPWTLEQLRSLLGEELTPILDVAFERDESWRSRYYGDGDGDSPEKMDGFEAYLRGDPQRRGDEIRKLSAKGRSYGLGTLARLGLVEGAYFVLAFDQTGDSAKSARESATLALRSAPAGVLEAKAREAWPKLKQAQKSEIAKVLAASKSETAIALLRDLAQAETNATTKAELMLLVGQDDLATSTVERERDGPAGYLALDGERIATPPMPPVPADTPPTPALRTLIDQIFDLWREEAETYNRQNRDKKPFYRQQVPPPGAAQAAIAAMMDRGITGPLTDPVRGGPGGQAAGPRGFAADLFAGYGGSRSVGTLRAQVMAHPDLTLWHLLQFVNGVHGDVDARAHALFDTSPQGQAMRERLGAGQDIRVYAAVLSKLGGRGDTLSRFLLQASYWAPDLGSWPADALWPHMTDAFDLIDEAMGLKPRSGKETLSEICALEMLSHFPKTPARYASALLDRAIGDRKLVRHPARTLLAGAPNLEQLLVPLLKHPKGETRSGAAEWLADRGNAAAIEPLLTATRAEGAPAAKAAMLSAIARLGGNIGEFVSAGALLKEAEVGLKKAPPKGLDWFPFDAMPAVRQVGGDWLDPKVLRWWLILAARLKEPGANAWFELLLDELEPKDAATLGLAVMSAWISYDSRAPSAAEANAYAEQNVDATLQSYRRWQPDMTRETVFSMLRQTKLKQYYGSGNDQKGVLALASRASGPEAVNQVRAFFRDHYMRTAQCKALLACLAANPSPVSIQFVLSISRRWRTRGVQEFAGELVAGIAERRGWTSEQLADRTIPSGGFDDDGVMELPVGDRSFTARLDAAGRISLFNADGKTVQNLPASAQGDEAAAELKESKATLTTARKEVKQVFEFQARRLYEALCVGREWPVAEWDEFLLRHPLMSRLVQRLVWLGLDDAGARVASFRPMEDLTLTGPDDATVDPARFKRVSLAHSTSLSEAERETWRRHLTDYEVEPLFDQFGRPTLTAEVAATEITDRKGWLIETFKLRGVATRLGYARGQAEDGGWFLVYQKPFDVLGLTAVIEFTGSSLPEENRGAALVALRFVKQRKGWLRWDDGVPLSSVPPVLLSETWNDLHDMAAAGTGFDAEWEKKSGW